MIVFSVIGILLGILLLLLVCILLFPLIIEIDTNSGLYRLRLPGIARFQVVFSYEELIEFRIGVFFFRFRFNPFRSKKKEKDKKKDKKAVKKKMDLSAFLSGSRLAPRILRSFRVRRLWLEMDSGDVISNAFLFPAAYALQQENIRISINNESRNSLHLIVQNRLIRIVAILVRHYIKTKFNH